MNKTTILIGTTNFGKIEAVKLAFEKYGNEFGEIEVLGLKAESEVADQPVNKDTFLGAQNRIKNLKKYAKDHGMVADYYAAIESGMVNFFGIWQVVNVAVLENNRGLQTVGQSAGFTVPSQAAQIALKTNLSDAMDQTFILDSSLAQNRRQGKGGIGLLTDDVITRVDLGVEAFVMALIAVRKTCWQEQTK